MILNEAYYQSLLRKYVKTDNHSDSIDIIALLTSQIILSKYREFPVHFNFPSDDNSFLFTVEQLFKKLSNYIYCNTATFPSLEDGEIVKSKKEIRVGKPKPQKLLFKVKNRPDGMYNLHNEKYNLKFENITYDELLKKYTPIQQNVRNRTLQRYFTFFEELNNGNVHGFFPTNFEKKIVFISSKTIWDNIKIKLNIPSIYLPNTREEGEYNEIKTIPALSDCIAYFTPKYSACYENILQQNISVDTIVVCNSDENCIQQVLQDKIRFKFNVVVVSNTLKRIPTNLTFWNWFKEEKELIENLW